jgi:predicted DNA-binding WGR domain protein
MSQTQTIHCTTTREARRAHNEGRRWRLRCVFVGFNPDNETRHSDKFWQLEGRGGRVTRRWGRRGGNGQTRTDSIWEGLEKFSEKLCRGYRVAVA